MLCTKNFDEFCDFCKDRWVITAETTTTDDDGFPDDIFACYETEEDFRRALNAAKETSILEGIYVNLGSIIGLVPKGDKK